MKSFFLQMLASALLLLGSCTKTVDIQDVKGLDFEPDNNWFGPSYRITGYVGLDPIPFLVKDTFWLGVNKPMPDSVFVLLTGDLADSLAKYPERYEGALLELKGEIVPTPMDAVDSTSFGTVFKIKSLQLLSSSSTSCSGPLIVPICTLSPSICAHTAPAAPRKFALLYSGGKNIPNAKERFWNDLEFMYHTLRTKYGFTDDNIIVVYKNKGAESSTMTVDYAATNMTNVDNAFIDLIGKIGTVPQPNDLLFVFTTNHGVQSNDLNGDDGNPNDENISFYKHVTTAFNLSMSDDVFAQRLNNIPSWVKIICLHQPCYSGGFLKDCAATNRINISAAGEFEDSFWLSPCKRYSAFSYYFTAAMWGSNHDGSALRYNPDLNIDGQVSILEAYWYAKKWDATSHHFLEDTLIDGNNGTDIPIPVGPYIAPGLGFDGNISAVTFL